MRLCMYEIWCLSSARADEVPTRPKLAHVFFIIGVPVFKLGYSGWSSWKKPANVVLFIRPLKAKIGDNGNRVISTSWFHFIHLLHTKVAEIWLDINSNQSLKRCMLMRWAIQETVSVVKTNFTSNAKHKMWVLFWVCIYIYIYIYISFAQLQLTFSTRKVNRDKI